MKFTIHTPETAPEQAKPILAGAKKAYGFVPNLLATMAEAPALLKAYTTVSGIFDESSLSATERQVVLLTVSSGNECKYCVAAHTVIAGMQKVHGITKALSVTGPHQGYGSFPRSEQIVGLQQVDSRSRGGPAQSRRINIRINRPQDLKLY